MSHNRSSNCPPHHPSRLLDGGLLFIGRARNLDQRLDALAAIAAARVPSQQIPDPQDIDASAPNYCPGLSRQAMR